tara:strand:+ start:863 stop:1168 length:306 start_codon:yes stop_codon:yes gene_type:complete
MGISRYSFTGRRKNDLNQAFVSTTSMNSSIRQAVLNGTIDVVAHTLEQGERIDSIAYLHYNDSDYWWVIAAASGIGWNLQVPPGTLIQIPVKIEQVMRFVG